MKKTLLSLLLLALCSNALAQRELVNAFDAFNDQLLNICGQIDDFGLTNIPDVNEATTWVCGLRPSLDRASLMMNNLMLDANGMFANSLGDVVGLASTAFGDSLGAGFDNEIAAAADAIAEGVRTGEVAFAPAVGKLLARANQVVLNSLDEAPPAGASLFEREAAGITQNDPVRIGAEMQQLKNTTDTLMRSARSQDVANQAREYAAMAFARGDEEQLLKRTTSPTPLDAKGVADEADDRADTANSSRAVFHAAVKMQADSARLQAVSTSNITTAIKELGVQQTLTTEQLSSLIQTMSEEQINEYKEWRSEYIKEAAEISTRARDTTQALNDIAYMLRTTE